MSAVRSERAADVSRFFCTSAWLGVKSPGYALAGIRTSAALSCVFSERIRARECGRGGSPSRPRRVTVQARNRPARRSGPTNTEYHWDYEQCCNVAMLHYATLYPRKLQVRSG